MKIRGVSRADWGRRFVKLLALVWRTILFRTTFIAVTGSVGKTTAKELLAAILAGEGRTLANAGTYNEAMDVVRTILRARPWHRFVVLELGTDAPGWIARSASIARPDIGLILRVARTHTPRFGTLENIAREKASLLRYLRRHGVAVLNQDDPRVAEMVPRSGIRVVRFGETRPAEVRAADVEGRWPARLSLTLLAGERAVRVSTRLVGIHWVPSVLGAASAALACGVSLETIAGGLAAAPPTPGRMDPRLLPSGAVMLRDAYTGSIDTFGPAFQVLREARAARKILAITTVTDDSDTWNGRLCRIVREAAGVTDTLILVGARHGTRRPRREAAAIGFPAESFYCFETLPEAAEFLRGFLKAGDLCLLRGKSGDHMDRLYLAQTREVACWDEDCPKMILCEDCPTVFAP